MTVVVFFKIPLCFYWFSRLTNSHARFASARSRKHGLAQYMTILLVLGRRAVSLPAVLQNPETRVLLEAGSPDTKPEIQVPSAWPTLLGSRWTGHTH